MPRRVAPGRVLPLRFLVMASVCLTLVLFVLFAAFVKEIPLGKDSLPPPPPPPPPLDEPYAPEEAAVDGRPAPQADARSIPTPPLDHTRGWSGPALFHTMEDGLKIQGSLLVNKQALVFDLDNTSIWQVASTCGQHICARKYLLGRCEWCSAHDTSRCVAGALFVGRSRDERGTTMNGFGKVLALLRSDTARPDMATMFTIFFNCALEAPTGGDPGRLRVQGMPGFSVTVLATPPKAAQPPEDIVCSRGLFGDVEAETVVKWTHHYTQVLGFSRAIVYQIGMDRGVTDHPAVVQYVREGVLVFVDLRDELQRVYGALSADVLMYSLCIGQIMLKQDCVVRARSMGARWTLHVDVDELLFMGVDTADAAQTWARFVEPVANKTWLSLGSHSVVSPVGKEPCACGNVDWPKFIAAEREAHRASEWSTGGAEPFDCTSRHHTPATCTGAYGMRKLAVRVNTPQPVNPIGVSIHVVFECAWPDGCGDKVKALGEDVSARLAYLRHYRCLNFALPQPCGRLKGAFWQSPQQIAAQVTHAEPPRKVVHRSKLPFAL